MVLRVLCNAVVCLTAAPPSVTRHWATVSMSDTTSESAIALLRQHMEQYHDLLCTDASPPPNAVDVYVRAAGSCDFWFAGKSCAREGSAAGADGPSLSVIRQKHLVLQHAKSLKPGDLSGVAELELWCAPLNGELSSLAGVTSATAIAESDVAIALVSALGPGDVGFLPAEQDEGTGKVICGSSAAHVRLRADGKFPMNCPWLCLVAREKCDG